MILRTMPNPTNATIAAYYLYGLEAGIVTLQQAKDWAFSVVESMDSPPADIIDVALSSGLPEINEKLNAVTGERDVQLAGKWLLNALNRKFSSNELNLERITKQAMQVTRSTALGDDEYYVFDSIDDSLSLAQSGTYGSVERCRSELENALSAYQEGFNA
jgi:hypothetical protein